ncbi:hypothetical protein WICMUC_005635 [Wickerhamomyces mucosus]|uniref:Uncharacterized protein n=1 Tax=Wickerhamomyces mucosus TaxID=1378264 RepID=A0A9P8P7M1_9ASCO|nr:hypothetical protein WICMUC_005635 [Wickerhamomyces mucosus]
MVDIKVALTQSSNEIFRKNSLQQIRDLSNELTELSQSKHNELRTLVSTKYRDLLKTGNTIIDIKELGQIQDQKLYNLSFLRDEKLNKLNKIEKNFEKLNNSFNQSSNLHEKSIKIEQEKIVISSDFWINTSILLEINDGFNIFQILTNLEKFNKFNQLKQFKNLLHDNEPLIRSKFEEINSIIIRLFKNTFFKQQDLYNINNSFNLLSLAFLNLKEFQSLIFNNLIKFIKIDSIKSSYTELFAIFDKFDQYTIQFQNYLIDNLSKLTKELNESIDNYKVGEIIDLYLLQINSEYLEKIFYISNGVKDFNMLYIIKILRKFEKNLQLLKKLKNDSNNDHKEELEIFISKIENLDRDNLLLRKYLAQLLDNLNK